jgi:acetyl-CoA carboxylase carboxyltransferase component
VSRIESKVRTGSAEFVENRSHNEALAEELRHRLEEARRGGPETLRERHHRRGKLLARERVDALLDSGPAFLELSSLAAFEQYGGEAPSAGIVTGVGRIHGRAAVIVANDATIKGGTYYPMTVKKHLRAQEIALENRLPCVYMVDSGGGFLPMQAEIFPDRTHFGRVFYNQARMSAEKIAQVSIVLGSCTAGGAYIPAMSDETIIVREQGTIFLGGPHLVRAATGEEATAEELGGGDVHTRISGVADHLADDDTHAIAIARSLFESLPRSPEPEVGRVAAEPPAYDPRELYGIIPKCRGRGFEAREMIARIVDGSRLDEFKPRYGETLVTGFAHLQGTPVGIVANDGALSAEASLKGAHFIELCCERGTPLLFLQNVTGLGGTHAPAEIAKDGAKMVNAVANAAVPKVTLIFGDSHGPANYAMCGRAYSPRFLFTWPSSRISILDGEEYAAESSAYFATSRLWDDGILDPPETHDTLGLALTVATSAPIRKTRFGVFRM